MTILHLKTTQFKILHPYKGRHGSRASEIFMHRKTTHTQRKKMTPIQPNNEFAKRKFTRPGKISAGNGFKAFEEQIWTFYHF